MATLDDKLLGEKLHYYCSSSEDEDESDCVQAPPEAAPGGITGGPSGNTGPKGVLEDWRRFKQLEAESREESSRERAALEAKLALTCRSDREEQELKEKEAEREIEALLEGDSFLETYMANRMKEMMAQTVASSRKFGSVIELETGESFLTAVDSEDPRVTVIVLIYSPNSASPGTEAMIGSLACLAAEHPTTKFCQILSSAAHLSNRFKASGVPAILVYRGGELVGSWVWVQLSVHLGDDFYSTDLEMFLVEHGMLQDREAANRVAKIRQGGGPGEDSD